MIWGEEQQNAFEEVKPRLIRPPIIHIPNNDGRFHLYSDMSKVAIGSALYQIQNEKPKLIAYASKRLHEAARNYLITELELSSLAIIKKGRFDVIVDPLALTHIIKSKVELEMTRIRRLLELISSYSFNLYYIKGKDMILSDFLSQQKHDNSNLHDLIPISFNMHIILNKRYYNLELMDRYLVQTQSQTKSSGIVLFEVHGVKKILNTNTLQEKQKTAPQVKKGSKNKPRLGQGRERIKCKKPKLQKDMDELTDKLQGIPKILATQNITKNRTDFPMH